MDCSWCHRPLTEDEEESPEYTDGIDGEPICEDCYCEQMHFTCAWCAEHGLKTDQHHYVVVFSPQEVELSLAGLYRVDRTPYAVQPIIGPGWLEARNLTWLGPVPAIRPWVDSDGEPYYPCGHLCAECQEQALAEVRYGLRCMVAAL